LSTLPPLPTNPASVVHTHISEAGPPKIFIQDVFDFLLLLKKGPPPRSLSEAKRIIEIMNIGKKF
jgi:hypothetical protein